ncbi:hypothetical protein AK812_SmicGene9307 [Symbiodinium microadriaticum]|uniref:AP2/ERF domain-containing protein n=1 Tax=Symbiodinium microadriaticum TaxID=2951 RepID=A0A1Q9EIP1_SYMMI|nr:hypothetical protein AK812_SmicGene9307 [Symbiodinium microadriaticum]
MRQRSSAALLLVGLPAAWLSFNITAWDFGVISEVARAELRTSRRALHSSQFEGVSWHDRYERWQAQVVEPEEGVSLSLGLFASEQDAAKAYDCGLLALKASEAPVNFPAKKYKQCDIDHVADELEDVWFPRQSARFMGVYRTLTSTKWRAELEIYNVKQFLGSFDDEEEASLCSCWERQRLPTDFPPGPPPPPTRTHEPSASAAAADVGEDDEEADFDLRTANTFLEYRQVARIKKRSHSMPKCMRPCRVETVIPAAAGNMEAHDKVSRVPEMPPLDDRFEPFLTPEMVSAERRWKREVLGRLAWRNVPARHRPVNAERGNKKRRVAASRRLVARCGELIDECNRGVADTCVDELLPRSARQFDKTFMSDQYSAFFQEPDDDYDGDDLMPHDADDDDGEDEDDEQELAARAVDAAIRSTGAEKALQLRMLNFCTDADYFEEDSWEEEAVPRGASSRFMGVTYHQPSGQFLARFGRRHLGLYDEEDDAARAFDKASHERGGRTNFHPSTIGA